MSNIVKLYVVQGDDDRNNQAKEMLSKVKDITINFFICPKGLEEYRRVPFMEDPTGYEYSGIDGIRGYVDKMSKIS